MLNQLCGHTLKPMDHQIITVPVTKDLGVDVNMTAHVLTGREPGPTPVSYTHLRFLANTIDTDYRCCPPTTIF